MPYMCLDFNIKAAGVAAAPSTGRLARGLRRLRGLVDRAGEDTSRGSVARGPAWAAPARSADDAARRQKPQRPNQACSCRIGRAALGIAAGGIVAPTLGVA